LIKGYSSTGHFKVTHKIEEFTFTDADRIKLLEDKSVRIKTVFEVLTPVMIELAKLAKTDPFAARMQMDNLRDNHPKEVKLLDDIGLEEAQRLKFNVHSIRSAIRTKQEGVERSNFEFIDYLDDHFKVGDVCVPSATTRLLEIGIKRFKLFKLTANLDLLRVYFKLSEERVPAGRGANDRHQRGFLIERRLVV
jgi:hypothetical protein